MTRLAFILLLVSATQAAALDISLPGGIVTRTESSPAASIRLPVQAWTPVTTLTETEGAIRRTAYKLESATRTTLQLIDPARTSLENEGYSTVFGCADAACGGFDFRFQLDLLPEPDMHVDLGNYRYLLMQKEGASPHTVSLLASASATAGFLHVTEVSDAEFPEAADEPEVTPEIAPEVAPPVDELINELQRAGHAVLSDLEFETGSADLGPGPYNSLTALAAWLTANPSARIALVGHTDAVGSLEANTSLSRRRAAAVANRLTASFATSPEQLQYAGAGFLSPVAPNTTPEGRAANRRVEAVLLSLE